MRSTSMNFHQSVFVLLVGIVLGTVFTFGMQYWNAPLERGDSIRVETVYVEHRVIMQDASIKEIAMDCTDGNRYFLNKYCIDADLMIDLDQLEPETEILMLRHPNSNTILEIVAEERKLLNFEDSVEKLASEAKGFLVLGLVMYAGAAKGAWDLVRMSLGKTRKKRRIF